MPCVSAKPPHRLSLLRRQSATLLLLTLLICPLCHSYRSRSCSDYHSSSLRLRGDLNYCNSRRSVLMVTGFSLVEGSQSGAVHGHGARHVSALHSRLYSRYTRLSDECCAYGTSLYTSRASVTFCTCMCLCAGDMSDAIAQFALTRSEAWL